jgi:hypothetical protein
MMVGLVYTPPMKSLFSDAIKHLVRARRGDRPAASATLEAIVTDLSSKKHDVSEHRAKAQDAIDHGTKLTKRRIPL